MEGDRGVNGAELGAGHDVVAAVACPMDEMREKTVGCWQGAQGPERLGDFRDHRFPVEHALRHRQRAGKRMHSGGGDRIEFPGGQVAAVAGQAAGGIVAAAEFSQGNSECPFLKRYVRALGNESDGGKLEIAVGLGDPVH